MGLIEQLAVEIDRTVLSVGTRAGARHRDRFMEQTADVSDPARRLLPRLSYFLLAGPIPSDFVSVRIPYTAVDVVSDAVDAMVDSGHLIAVGDGEVAPGETLAPALRTVVDGRREMTVELWSEAGHAAESASDVAGRIRATVPDEASVASRHVAIPEPDDPWSRLYERLTTIRYIRADAHRRAWRGFGCEGPLMVQLTTAWHGDQPSDPGALEDGGWWDGALTDEGRRVRDEIELRTNEYNAEYLAGAGGGFIEDLLAALGGLPGTPVARPF